MITSSDVVSFQEIHTNRFAATDHGMTVERKIFNAAPASGSTHSLPRPGNFG